MVKKIKELLAPKDLTTGEPWKRILEFTTPMIIGNIIQQLYNTVDTFVVGKYIGDNALAAVGSAGPVINLLIVLFVGIAVGSGIMVSQYYGAKNREKLSKTIGTCITLIGITSVIIMIIGPLITRPLLVFLKTPDSLIDWCSNYLVIMFLGISGMSYYNILAAILQGLGDSLSALIFLIISTIINIVLDVLFVAKFNMGVEGVAIATVIAQGVSAILCIVRLMKMKTDFDLNLKNLKLSKEHTLELLKLGLPSGLTQAIFSFAMISVQSLTNSFGEMVIASNVIIMRVDGFAMMPNFSFGSAMTAYTGQNVGAGKLDRVEKGLKQGITISVIISTILTILILVFGRQLMMIFTKTEELINLSMHLMRILAIGYIVMGIMQCLLGVIRGAGDTITPMYVSIVTTVIIRIPVAYGIAYMTRSEFYPVGRPESVFISYVVSWICGTIIAYIFYKKGNWRKKAITNKKEEILENKE